MRAFRNAAVILACASFVGCTSNDVPASTAAVDTSAEAAVLDGFQEAWEKAYNSGDAAGLVAVYADDAVVSPPGSPQLRHAQLEEFFKKDLAANAGVVFDINPPDDRAISADVAWETGTWTAKDKSGNTLDSGKYLTGYRKRDGKWLMSADAWNSNTPPAPPPAEQSTAKK